MDKILVHIFVPVLTCSFDVFIHLNSPMHEILELIKKAIKELSDGRFVGDESTLICHEETGTIIDINLSVYELEIHNGSKLILI